MGFLDRLKPQWKDPLLAILVATVLIGNARTSFGQQDPPAPACCRDIYNTGHNLGLAYFMAKEYYPLSDRYFNNLMTFLKSAGVTLVAANRDCSRINPAWPDWQQRLNDLKDWQNRLTKSRDETTLRGAAAFLSNARMSYANALMVQIIAGRYERRSTCEQYYFLLGFDLSHARACLITSGAASIPRLKRIDCNAEAQQAFDQARADVEAISKLRPVTGSCAPLENLQTLFTRWSANYDSLETAGRNKALVVEIVNEAMAILDNCQSTLGGGASAGPHPSQVFGRWRVSLQSFDRNSGQWREESTDQAEFLETQGAYGYQSSDGGFWILEDQKLYVLSDQGARLLVLTLQANGQWIGYGLNPDGTFVTKEGRMVLTRIDR